MSSEIKPESHEKVFAGHGVQAVLPWASEYVLGAQLAQVVAEVAWIS